MCASALACVVLAGAAAPSPAASNHRQKAAGELPSAAGTDLTALLDVVRRAERVEALPVLEEGVGLSAVYRVVEKPVTLDGATARGLGRALAAYDWTASAGMACMFQPAVAFRFRRGDATALVHVCFLCGEMVLDGVDGPAGGKKALAPDLRRTLLGAARKAFPGQFEGFER